MLRWLTTILVLAACTPALEPAGLSLVPIPVPASAAEDPFVEPLVARLEGVDYLAIGAAAHRSALERLIAHRRSQGHVVAFLSIEEVMASGENGRERLRQIVQTAHGRFGTLRYLLLAGDVAGEAAIPTFEEHDPVLDDHFVTDHPYGDVSGRPLAIGRVPVQDAAALAAFGDKIIAYETSDRAGLWQRRLALFAGAADFGPVVDRLIENHAHRLLDERLSYDWDVNVLFAREGSPYAPRFYDLPGVIEEELEEGALVAVYVGHGYTHGFAPARFRDYWYPSLTARQAASLAIPSGRPLFLSLSCLTGNFAAGEVSLGETLILNPQGPVAVFAATGRSHPYANALFADSLLDTFLGSRASTVGEGLVTGAEDMMTRELAVAQLFVSSGEAQALKRSNRRMYHLLGDPATRPRYPRRLEVSLEGPVAPGRRLGLRIHGVAEGTPLELTFETRRSALPASLTSEAAIARLDDFAAQDALDHNRSRALDKVVARAIAVAPAAELRLPWKLAPGRYYLKVASETGATTVGHLPIDIP